MKQTLVLYFLIFFLISPYILDAEQQNTLFFLEEPSADAIVIPDTNPFFGLLGSGVACWYDTSTNNSGLLPLLVHHQGMLSDAQQRFLERYSSSTNPTLLVLGEQLTTNFTVHEILGTPVSVALALASQRFDTASSLVILPYTSENAYHLGLLATPLASYLNIPLVFYDDNQGDIQALCTQLQTTQAYIIGNISLDLPTISLIHLRTEEAIYDMVLSVIKNQFGVIHYLTMTNPADVLPPAVIDSHEMSYTDYITNKKVIILSKEINLRGNDTRYYTVSVPDGITHVQITGEINQIKPTLLNRFFPIDPLLFMTLTDAKGNVVAYGNSMGYDVGATYLETLVCNASGEYTLEVTVYNGCKGGFFVQRGLSNVDAHLSVTATITNLTRPHYPQIPKLSMIAPYLTTAHGGLLIANASWELTDDSYATAANGVGTGPWYNESLHVFTNEKVNATVDQLKKVMHLLETHDLQSDYLNGPAWLALVADTTMIPMYYYSPSQGDIPEKGLPSDNPYSLNQNLSIGRVISWDVADVSVLLARTLFYETVCGPPTSSRDWHHRFSFVFGEGFGETGGIFHQLPYAREIRTYGFVPTVYGDLRNGRQITERLQVYTGANYIEYLGHGDWFWFPTSYYGFDIYSKAVDVAHAKDWVFDKPSVFLSSACLMGRIDGLPPEMNIGLTMLHAGCNAFIGATRETGQESGLTTLENHLIVDDWSMGEALRGEKQVDKELPTYYVRTLYGDPAFNPYEPHNGFHNQGRPLQ